MHGRPLTVPFFAFSPPPARCSYPYIRPIGTAASLAVYQSYNQFGIVEALLFGVMGAALAAAYMLVAGICKAAIGAARHKLDARLGRPARIVILATLGGATTGLLGWGLPLVLTDGAEMLTPVLMEGGAIGSSVLAASCFAK